MSHYKRREPVRLQPVSDQCVSETVRDIIRAQNEATEINIPYGCDKSVKQLLTKHDKNEHKPRHTTIPFILYCRETCKPFIGSGVFKSPPNPHRHSFFGCIETPVFRAKQIVNHCDNCAKLELLLPVTKHCTIPEPVCDTLSDVCPFFPADSPITDFVATGICLTVDLNQFHSITCLDPITPLPAKAYPPLAPSHGKLYDEEKNHKYHRNH